jgi:hypothetical protein
MKFLGKRGQEFIPMLERYFRTELEVDVVTPILSIYRDIQVDKFTKSRDDLTLKVGLHKEDTCLLLLDEIKGIDYLLVTKVCEVLCIIRKEVDLDPKTVILCTLRTHIEELKKFSNNLCIYLPFEDKSLTDLPYHPESTSEIILDNFNSKTALKDELLKCKFIIASYTNCFEPGDYNYANEYNEIYHLARILKVDVFTSINPWESSYLHNSLEHLV